MTEMNTLSNPLGNSSAKTAGQMASNAHMSIDHAVDRTTDAIRPAFEHLVQGAHQAVESLSLAASQAATKLELTGETLKNAQARVTDSARGYVREKPMTAVGVAVAAGFLLSWLLRQR